MKYNLLHEYYKTRATDNNASDLVNMYLDITPQKQEEGDPEPKYSIVAYPTDGLVAWNSGTGSVVRGGIEVNGVVYFVVDNTFYSYDSSGVRTSRGTLLTSTGLVDISTIFNQITITDGTYGYNYNTGTNTFAQITDVDFPATAQTSASTGGYVFVSPVNSATVYGSDISDGTSWNPLSFSTKSVSSDFIKRLITLNDKLVVVGTYTSEIWYNDGGATFSYSIVSGSNFNHGTPASRSVARGTEFLGYLRRVERTPVLYMLGQSRTGGLAIIAITESGIRDIHNQGIIERINSFTTVSDAIGFVYEKDGHEFYTLTFPTEGVTFQYDTTNKLWLERQSYVNSSYTRWMANCYVYGYNKHLVGDYQSGKIYYLDRNTYTENSTPILRRLVTNPSYAGGRKAYLNRLQLDVQTGVGSNKTITLEVSKDSGQTYPTSYSGTLPAAGGRLFWDRLGYTQNAFCFRITTTTDALFTILGAQAEATIGIH